LPRCVFVCFVQFSKQTPIVPLNNINTLASIMYSDCSVRNGLACYIHYEYSSLRALAFRSLIPC
jgi:hypothetical protein